MNYGELQVSDGVAQLTVVNSKALNIIGTAAITELTQTIRGLRDRSDVRVLILRGAGDKAFIGGADIHEMATLTPSSAERFIANLRDLCDALRLLPVPVIARVAGWCLGGGLEVAMACDLRIASSESKFGMPEVAVGIPSVIHAALMPRLIGVSRATWLLLTAEIIDSEKAERWGLVQEVCAPQQLDGRVAKIAQGLAGFGAAALQQQKALLRAWEDAPIDEAIDATVAEFGKAFATGEPQHHMGEFIARKKR